jgi:hypothetical protein
MKRAIIVALAIVCCAHQRARAAEEEELFPALHTNVVATGAVKTWLNYGRWQVQAKGTSVEGDQEIPANLWDESLAKLKPKYIYRQGIDIVIVLRQVNGNEEGLYVVQMISSVGPHEGYPFTLILLSRGAGGGDVYAFQRKGCLRKLPEAKKGKQ